MSADWGDQVEPEYEQLRRMLSGEPEPEAKGHGPLLIVSVVGAAILWLTAVGVFDGKLPALVGGLLVVGVGVACWMVEHG